MRYGQPGSLGCRDNFIKALGELGMGPRDIPASHSRKGAARHRYYASSALIQGRPQTAGSVARVPGAKVEAAIVEAVRGHIGPDAPGDDTDLIHHPRPRGKAHRNRHLIGERASCRRNGAVEQDAASTPP